MFLRMESVFSIKVVMAKIRKRRETLKVNIRKEEGSVNRLESRSFELFESIVYSHGISTNAHRKIE